MIPKNPALAGLTLIFSLLEGLLLVLPVVRNLTPRLPARVLIPLSAVFSASASLPRLSVPTCF